MNRSASRRALTPTTARVVLILAVGTSLSTGAWAQDPRFGLTLDYNEVMMSYERDGTDILDHYDTVGASAVLDLEYVRLTAGYSNNIGNYIRFVDGGEQQDDGYIIRYASFTALGKAPFRFAEDKLTLWPALGLRGAYNLTYEHDGANVVNDEPHDLSLVGGVGLDYDVTPEIALTSALLGTYALTPGMGDGIESPRVFSLGLGLGLLFQL